MALLNIIITTKILRYPAVTSTSPLKLQVKNDVSNMLDIHQIASQPI
ncbi:hypothetical protein SAMN05661091_2751 [Paenibacillus uliginis N3/975]|uniref:Uncharacterized protein n=1 Tax=Paenibacillus uliginis N3/975 TaxID=1313296 RepID=A0A1X7HE60_9BACL|nr:hypothetical protein SAMN05661091_2751 [Paenibacillus uliginis N3/975]